MKVLLVDDDDAIRRLIARVLEQRRHTVFESRSPYGVSALILRQCPELVVIDVRMPGLSGPELCRLITELPLASPPRVVLWSSLEQRALDAVAREAGDLPTISKLAGPMKIVEAIELYGRKSTSGAMRLTTASSTR